MRAQAETAPEPIGRRADAPLCRPAPQIARLDRGAFDDPAMLARWDRLAACASEPNPFYESWFLLPSLRALDPGGEVLLLALLDGDCLRALMPVVRSNSYYGYPVPHLRNWCHANCFLGLPLVERGYEGPFWRALLDWCDGAAHSALFLHLTRFSAGGPLRQALSHELAARPRRAATVLRESRALLATELDPEAYLAASLSAKKRKELRRQHRRLEELGTLRIERQRGDDSVAAWVEEFTELERRGWKGRKGSALGCDPATAALFAEALAGAARRGRLDRMTLRLDGQPVAMLGTLIAPPGAFSFKTTFDERLARFSPGVLLQCANLHLLGDERVEWIDSCASEGHPMIDHLWRERRFIEHHSLAIGGPARQRLFGLIAWRETGKLPRGLA